MLILSQDKTTLLNLDHITRIKNAGGEIIAVDDSRVTTVLGQYDDPKQAAGIILEISEKYAIYLKCEGGPLATVNAYVQPIMFEPPKVYDMPPKWEEEKQ